ncbi:MAG TPA: hypothetical protein PLD23_05080 [Armatimonadota bacterium]|nr:hypothetical protein [Armatimonadota bacterium]
MRQPLLAFVLALGFAAPSMAQLPAGVSSIGDLRQAIAEHRRIAAEVLARVTRVTAVLREESEPADWGATVVHRSVGIAPGALFVDELVARSAWTIAGSAILADPKLATYWRTADGRVVVLRREAPTDGPPLAHRADASARELPAPDAAIESSVEECLQVSLGPPEVLPGPIERALAGVGETLRDEFVDGLFCVRADALLEAGGCRSVWFAPERGYLMVRAEDVTQEGGEQTARIHRVLQCARAEGAGWFPSLAQTVTYRRAHGAAKWRVTRLDLAVTCDIGPLDESDQLLAPWAPHTTRVYTADGEGPSHVIGDCGLDYADAAVDGDLVGALPAAPDLKGGASSAK